MYGRRNKRTVYGIVIAVSLVLSGFFVEVYEPKNQSFDENNYGNTKYETVKPSAGVENENTKNTYTLENLPDFQGVSYVCLNNNQPKFTKEEKSCLDTFEVYSEIDKLGRCGQAFANISIETMPTKDREAIGHIRPSGWHTVKYNDIIEGNYLYNRCHLIAFALAGENANEKNLITGTRYMNVEGMLEFENKVNEYVKDTNNHVLYRVTPVFVGEELVARGVLMEAWSVEDNGEGICFYVFCYNVQPGIEIDYLTGNSKRSEAG